MQDPSNSYCTSTADGTSGTGGTLSDNLRSAPQMCEAKAGNPISYLKGTKTQSLATGFSVGSTPLVLNYDTNKHFAAVAAGLTAKTFGAIPSAGALWETSLHKSLHTNSGGFGVRLFRGDTRAVSFAYNGTAFVADANINDTLSLAAGVYTYVNSSGQTVETYNKAGQLLTVAGGSGSKLVYTYSTAAGAGAPAAGYLMRVTDEVGRFISFAYTLPAGGNASSDGLISVITNTAGQTINLGYDANQNLSTITWPDSQVHTLHYENASFPWALTGQTDERGVRYATYGYDASGRAISTELAGGVERYSVTYATPAQINVATSYNASTGITTRTHEWVAPAGVTLSTPNGQTSVVTATSILGANRITAATQPAGAGCSAASNAATYDAKGNVTSTDDFLGVRTCFAYDTQNRETVRVEGLANTAACAPVLVANATLPVGARKFTTQYHPDWRVPTVATGPGSVSTVVYQGQPDPFSGNALASCMQGVDVNNSKVVLNVSSDGPGTPTDSGPKGYVLTPAGTPTISTAQSKFGGASLAFAGLNTASRLKAAASTDWKLDGASTIEVWAYPTAFNVNGGQMVAAGGGNYAWNNTDGIHWVMQTAGTNLITFLVRNGSEIVGIGGVSIPNAWNHVAVTYDGAVLRMFINGALVQSAAMSLVPPSSTPVLHVGGVPGEGGASTNAYSGYLDEIRITKGVARYTSNFSVPTVAINSSGLPNGKLLPVVCKTVTQGALDKSSPAVQTQYGDVHQNNVVLLAHADGPSGSATVVDSSSKANQLARTGAPTITSAQSKFGGSSLTFNSSGTVANNFQTGASFDWSLNSPTTIEFWAYPTAFNVNGGRMVSAGGGAVVWNGTNGIQWYVQTTATAISAGFWNGLSGVGLAAPIALNAWSHVAVTYDGSMVRLFVNGVQASSAAATITPPSAAPILGLGFIPGEALSNGNGYSGYLDEIRITKGVARYTSNFMAPASPFYSPNSEIVDPSAATAVNTFTYDVAGRILTSKDTLNRTTTYAYYPTTALTGTAPNQVGYTVGDLASITNPAGMVTTFDLYDPLGRILKTTDPKGVITEMTYTPRGWVSTVKTTAPGLPSRTTSYTYDNAGQLTGVTTADGASVAFTYDAAHRLIGATDAKGNKVAYTLDNMGNRINEQIKDPSGTLQRSISRSFDALNRLQQLTTGQ